MSRGPCPVEGCPVKRASEQHIQLHFNQLSFNREIDNRLADSPDLELRSIKNRPTIVLRKRRSSPKP